MQPQSSRPESEGEPDEQHETHQTGTYEGGTGWAWESYYKTAGRQ